MIYSYTSWLSLNLYAVYEGFSSLYVGLKWQKVIIIYNNAYVSGLTKIGFFQTIFHIFNTIKLRGKLNKAVDLT